MIQWGIPFFGGGEEVRVGMLRPSSNVELYMNRSCRPIRLGTNLVERPSFRAIFIKLFHHVTRFVDMEDWKINISFGSCRVQHLNATRSKVVISTAVVELSDWVDLKPNVSKLTDSDADLYMSSIPKTN